MRIMFLNSARTWGGNEKWTVMACEVLSHEHQVSLIYRAPVIGDRYNGFRVRLPFISGIDLLTLIPLIILILGRRVDIVIPTKRKDYMLAGIAARICGRKNILRLGIVRSLHSRRQRRVYREMADGIIVNAEKIRENLLKTPFMKDQKIRVIYNGLDTDRLNQLGTEMCKPASFLVTSMGALIPRKGMDLLIRGFAGFLSKTEDNTCRLVIIGDGESRNDLEALIVRLKLQGKIFLVGHLDNPYPWLKASDLFVLISENEGLSNALAEAMYFKNAVITTRAGGASELIRHQENGWFTGPDPEDIGQAILTFYQDPVFREAVAGAGYSTVNRMMRLPRMAEEITGFCREILTGTGTG